MGAHLNAYTSREQTVYYAKAFSKDLPRGRKGSGVGRAQGCVCVSVCVSVCAKEFRFSNMTYQICNASQYLLKPSN